jgi:hypothetical protein
MTMAPEKLDPVPVVYSWGLWMSIPPSFQCFIANLTEPDFFLDISPSNPNKNPIKFH